MIARLSMRLRVHWLRAGQVLLPLARSLRPPRILRRRTWKSFYSVACSVFLAEGVASFLNLGYLDDPWELSGENPDDVVNRVSERLYEQVVSGADLDGSTVVEVGCGPGAGSAHLARTCHPASLLGIDLSDDLIVWCRQHHSLDNLEFRQGDAQNLPVEDNSVDAVVNVESSHCYPSRLRFFEEVSRVLRPGGSFLYADIAISHKRDEADAMTAQLRQAGLVIDHCVDITKNVLAARDAVSRSSFGSRLREKMPSVTVALVEAGLGLTGSKLYAEMANGRMRYVQWRASKPVEAASLSAAVVHR